jgi:hypothetical protein
MHNLGVTKPLFANIATASIVNDHAVASIDLQYPAGLEDDRILVGAAHNVFIGKVINQVGNKEVQIGPRTQFAVDVIVNIKGKLQGTVVVDQLGGYKGGVLYAVEDGAPLLQPGATYLLATRYNDTSNWYTLISHSNGSKLLSQDGSLTDAQLTSISEKDEKTIRFQQAYANEIVLNADIVHARAWNNYQSRNYDAQGNLIDDTVSLQEQAAPSSVVPANAPVSNSVASPVPTDAPTSDVASPTPSTDAATPTDTPTPTPIPSDTAVSAAS